MIQVIPIDLDGDVGIQRGQPAEVRFQISWTALHKTEETK